MKQLYKVHLSVTTDSFGYNGPEVHIVTDMCEKFNELTSSRYFTTLDKAFNFVEKQIKVFANSEIGKLMDTEIELKQYDFEDVPCKYLTTTFYADGGKWYIMGSCYPEKIDID